MANNPQHVSYEGLEAYHTKTKEYIDRKISNLGLSNVARSGNYRDLSNVPSEFNPSKHTHTADEILGVNSNIDYNQVSNAPTRVSQFVNDLNYVNADRVNAIVNETRANVTELVRAETSTAVANHNTNDEAHSDIRNKINNLEEQHRVTDAFLQESLGTISSAVNTVEAAVGTTATNAKRAEDARKQTIDTLAEVNSNVVAINSAITNANNILNSTKEETTRVNASLAATERALETANNRLEVTATLAGQVQSSADEVARNTQTTVAASENATAQAIVATNKASDASSYASQANTAANTATTKAIEASKSASDAKTTSDALQTKYDTFTANVNKTIDNKVTAEINTVNDALSQFSNTTDGRLKTIENTTSTPVEAGKVWMATENGAEWQSNPTWAEHLGEWTIEAPTKTGWYAFNTGKYYRRLYFSVARSSSAAWDGALYWYGFYNEMKNGSIGFGYYGPYKTSLFVIDMIAPYYWVGYHVTATASQYYSLYHTNSVRYSSPTPSFNGFGWYNTKDLIDNITVNIWGVPC